MAQPGVGDMISQCEPASANLSSLTGVVGARHRIAGESWRFPSEHAVVQPHGVPRFESPVEEQQRCETRGLCPEATSHGSLRGRSMVRVVGRLQHERKEELASPSSLEEGETRSDGEEERGAIETGDGSVRSLVDPLDQAMPQLMLAEELSMLEQAGDGDVVDWFAVGREPATGAVPPAPHGAVTAKLASRITFIGRSKSAERVPVSTTGSCAPSVDTDESPLMEPIHESGNEIVKCNMRGESPGPQVVEWLMGKPHPWRCFELLDDMSKVMPRWPRLFLGRLLETAIKAGRAAAVLYKLRGASLLSDPQAVALWVPVRTVSLAFDGSTPWFDSAAAQAADGSDECPMTLLRHSGGKACTDVADRLIAAVLERDPPFVVKDVMTTVAKSFVVVDEEKLVALLDVVLRIVHLVTDNLTLAAVSRLSDGDPRRMEDCIPLDIDYVRRVRG